MSQVPPARYLMRAKDLVDARYAEAITVDDLARRSRDQLEDALKKLDRSVRKAH